MGERDFINVREAQLKRGEEIKQMLKDSSTKLDTSFILEESVLILELSYRPLKSFRLSNITTIRELIFTPVVELLEKEYFGPHSLEEVRAQLAKYNLELLYENYPRTLKDPGNTESELVPILEESVLYLNISVRSFNCLKLMGISTIGELINTPIQDFKSVWGFGEMSLKKLEEELAKLGLEILNSSTYKAGQAEMHQVRKRN